MNRLALAPAAQADLDGIWDYTARHWGADQAELYLTAIRDACLDLAKGVRPSRPVDIRSGYRKLAVGSHVLFFRIADDGGIVVVRILHRAMDVERNL